MELKDYRQELDSIDDEMIKLFTRRMKTAADIAEYKKEHGLPVLDSKREREKLLDVAEKTPEQLREYAVALYSLIFELSRSSQNRILGRTTELTEQISAAIEKTDRLFPQNATVACQGVEGAYSQIACDKLFKSPSIMYFRSFEGVFQAVEKGLCQYGLLPIENSSYGSVNGVYDLMRRYHFHIIRGIRLHIDHNLLEASGQW